MLHAPEMPFSFAPKPRGRLCAAALCASASDDFRADESAQEAHIKEIRPGRDLEMDSDIHNVSSQLEIGAVLSRESSTTLDRRLWHSEDIEAIQFAVDPISEELFSCGDSTIPEGFSHRDEV
jgi:hypothetical protein